jgi:hypothetical protein
MHKYVSLIRKTREISIRASLLLSTAYKRKKLNESGYPLVSYGGKTILSPIII